MARTNISLTGNSRDIAQQLSKLGDAHELRSKGEGSSKVLYAVSKKTGFSAAWDNLFNDRSKKLQAAHEHFVQIVGTERAGSMLGGNSRTQDNKPSISKYQEAIVNLWNQAKNKDTGLLPTNFNDFRWADTADPHVKMFEKYLVNHRANESLDFVRRMDDFSKKTSDNGAAADAAELFRELIKEDPELNVGQDQITALCKALGFNDLLHARGSKGTMTKDDRLDIIKSKNLTRAELTKAFSYILEVQVGVVKSHYKYFSIAANRAIAFDDIRKSGQKNTIKDLYGQPNLKPLLADFRKLCVKKFCEKDFDLKERIDNALASINDTKKDIDKDEINAIFGMIYGEKRTVELDASFRVEVKNLMGGELKRDVLTKLLKEISVNLMESLEQYFPEFVIEIKAGNIKP